MFLFIVSVRSSKEANMLKSFVAVVFKINKLYILFWIVRLMRGEDCDNGISADFVKSLRIKVMTPSNV